MGCDTKQNSLKYLKDKKIIDDTRIIIDSDTFNKGNRYITALAVVKYGLNTGGKMMFRAETTSYKVIDRSYATSRTQNVTRAVPVDELFEKLDELHKDKTEKEEQQIESVLNREPINRVLNIGFRHSNENVNHYTETKSEAVNENKKVQISNKGFVNQKEDPNLYDNLVKEFKFKTGYEYNVNSVSFENLKNQQKFYDFAQAKGLKGMEVYNSRGELQMIEFNQPEFVKTEIDNGEMLKPNGPTSVTQTATEPIRTVLETKEKYNTKDANTILETYTLEQVNEMLEKDREGAIEIFNKLLYGDNLKTDTFVSDRDVNQQVNKCK